MYGNINHKFIVADKIYFFKYDFKVLVIICHVKIDVRCDD